MKLQSSAKTVRNKRYLGTRYIYEFTAFINSCRVLESREGLYALYEIFKWKHIANNQRLCSEKSKCSLKIENLLLRWQIACSLFLAKFCHSFAKISVRNVNPACKIQQERATSQPVFVVHLGGKKWFCNDYFHFFPFLISEEKILPLKGWCKSRTALLTSQRCK